MSRQSIICQSNRMAMTLLEVMLSLAILGGSAAAVGELARTSFQNARTARDLVQAELLAESILAKIRLGIIEMEPAFEIPVGSGYTANQADIVSDTHAVSEGNINDVLWLYSIEIVNVQNDFADSFGDYLIEIAVTVRQNGEMRRPVVCRLVRWIALEPEVEEEEEQ